MCLLVVVTTIIETKMNGSIDSPTIACEGQCL